MGKINSKQKGNRYERVIAELFTQISGVRYKRTPMSGAYRFNFSGDIMKSESQPSCFDNILIELKDRKTISMPEWITRTEEEMLDASYNKFILAFKYKAKNYFVINEELFKKLFKDNSSKRCNPD